jgi:hypothetical protein
MVEPTDSQYVGLLTTIVERLERSRYQAATAINAQMTSAYWEIGRLVVEYEQEGAPRAEYGDRLLARLAADLTKRFGRGFSRRNLAQMRQFYLAWPIVQTLSAQSPAPDTRLPRPLFALPWSHYVRLLSVKDQEARAFYETEALRNGWSVRQLDRQITTLFYERTRLSHDKAAMLSREAAEAARRLVDTISPQEAIKDPFVLRIPGSQRRVLRTRT